MRSLCGNMRTTTPLSLTLAFLLTVTVGCAGIRAPKTMTQGDVSVQLKKRNEEFTQEFEKQRDFAEYQAAKARWEQQRDPKGCREALEKLLARKPEHREGRLLLAELCLAEENPQAAYDQAKATLDTYPNDAQVQYTVALTLDALGNPAEAVNYYERATQMDPRSEAFAAAYRTATEACREEKRQSKATTIDIVESLDEVTAESVPVGYTAPSTRPTPANRDVLTGSAGPIDSTAAAESDPVAELLQKGQLALAEGSPPTALDCFRQAAALKPDNPQIPISAAAVALRANHPQVAVELLMPVAKQFPKSAGVHRMLGAAHYRLGYYKSSQVALQQALSLDKSSALSYLLMGCTLAKLGQGEASEAHFREARALDPRYKVVR